MNFVIKFLVVFLAIYQVNCMYFCLYLCPNTCSSLTCEENQIQIKGVCSCCPTCATLLNEGDSCPTISSNKREVPEAVCTSPLQCVNNKCAK
ncbi:unnamed protein product [Brassicogethes aeneus]|uniref:Uncharacterized protein n=1 Tax=Brassicogethes aeneus TaxID=1431903 RepID=A0A9P0B6S5_BRAAE|nr:unnamed protein product [Brassicogethes aeneus]